jgi:hypothetical protein
VNCCNQLYKGPINSIIKSKTRLISHVNSGYVTVLFGNNRVTAACTDKIQNGLETREAEMFWSVQRAPVEADRMNLVMQARIGPDRAAVSTVWNSTTSVHVALT